MSDSLVLPRFLLLAHAVVSMGLVAWFFGLIPRETAERRFLPLGLYMALTLLVQGSGWLACSLPAFAAVTGPFREVATVAAIALVAIAFWIDYRRHRSANNWPWLMRLCLLTHLTATYLWPAIAAFAGPAGRTAPLSSLPNFISVLALIWLVFSYISAARRRNHFLHWSLAAAVLGCLLIGGLVILVVHERMLHHRDRELMNRTTAFARLLGDSRLDIASRPEESPADLARLLHSICTTSDQISGAFLLSVDETAPRFLAHSIDENKSPTPHLINPNTYTRWLPAGTPEVQVFDDLEDDREWHLALVHVRAQPDGPPIAVLGVLVASTVLEASIAEPLMISESVLFGLSFLIYVCIAGYLRGVIRVWQRDILLEINASVSHQLLNTDSPTDVAADLVKQLQRRLGLLHASFWVYSDRARTPGFRIAAAAPANTSPTRGSWHPLTELPNAWLHALQRGHAVEGSLADLENPLPDLVLPGSGMPWALAESIELHHQPWGTLLLIFRERLPLSGEIRSALRALANAFSSSLAREERSEHLAAAEERLRTIVETSPDGFWDADYTHNHYYRSDRWWRMLGHEPPTDDRSPHAFQDLIEPTDLTDLRADPVESLPPGRKFRRREYRARHADGSIRWIESNFVELRPVHGGAVRAIGFDRDITQRHDYEMRLREAAESSARANRAKSEFLATMNHELRTPLNSVIGFATILDRSPLNATQREWVNSMRTSAELLLGLISDVLDFSRIEAGRLELEVSPFELRRAAEQALEQFSRQATEKQLALHFEFEGGHQPNWVLGDALRVRQILTNLVGNAIKFTDRGFVRLVVRRHEHEHWQFAVEDTGPGIPAHQLDSLFSRFTQLDASTTRAHGGAGLGLAISRELARAMQGDLTVTTEPGCGSVFTAQVFLPPSLGEQRRYTDHEVNLGLVLPVFAPDEADLAALANALAGSGTELRPCATLAEFTSLAANLSHPVSVIFPRAFRAEAVAFARALRPQFTNPACPAWFIALQPAGTETETSNPFDAELPAPLRRRDLINALDRTDGPLSRRAPVNPATVDSTSPATPPAPASTTESPPSEPAPLIIPPEIADDFRVLVAEDHPVNRDVVGTMLQQLGVPADFAANGAIAIEHLRTTRYQLALIDIQMPVLDGYGVANWVRAQWPFPYAPPRLIAVTANATHSDRERCLQAGMDDYVAKPLTFSNLSTLIDAHRFPPDGPQPADLPIPAPSASAAVPDTRPPTSPATQPVAGDELVDWFNFDSILSFTNAQENPEVLQRIISTYLQDRDQVLANVAAVDPTDQTETRRLLHKLKGSTGSLALMGAVETIKRLHDATEPPSAAERAEMLKQIRIDTNLAIHAVKQRYPWLNEAQI